MKKLAFAPLAAMLSVVPQIHAGEIGNEFMPFGYLQVPFGGHYVTDQKPTYGLALTQTSRFGSGVALSDNQRPPLLNLQFRGEELDAINLNGFNVLQKQVTYNANGGQNTVFGIQLKYVAMGAFAIGGLVAMCNMNEWDTFGCDDGDNDPPPMEEEMM